MVEWGKGGLGGATMVGCGGDSGAIGQGQTGCGGGSGGSLARMGALSSGGGEEAFSGMGVIKAAIGMRAADADANTCGQ